MRIIVSIILCFIPQLAMAETAQYFRISSGTGFFVNREYIITNAHVVTGCSKATIKGAVPEREVEVRVADVQRDLALLETSEPPPQFAPLRINIDDLKAGDKVLVIGYPGEEGARGVTKFNEAKVQELGPNVTSNPGHFYISDVIEHGNSGGPVFDTSGNVIGVVVAKTMLTTYNNDTHEKISEQRAGVAIDLSTLKQFLFDHGIFVQWTGSGLVQFADGYMEQRAKEYIVNVQCRLPADAPPAGN